MKISAENCRQAIRVNIALKMCAFFFDENIDGARAYTECFMCGTIDMSDTGMQIIHNRDIKIGDMIEFRTKNSINLLKCTKCSLYYSIRSKIEFMPITAKVVWTAKNRAGVEFVNLSAFNRNAISKVVWEKHISEIMKLKTGK